jgi:RNA polymerase sigma-70 factor (ECF subfamily)
VEQPIEPADLAPRSAADPDESLVAETRSGDAAAITELYRRHERRVFNLALRMTNNTWDAADLTQDVFIKVFANLASFKGDARFTTWLHRVATNVVYDHLRRRRADPLDDETLLHLASTPVGPARGGAGATWTSSSADLDSANVSTPADPLSSDLREALLALPEGFRAAVVLCDLLDFPYAEAAEILQIAEGTVKSRLFRARAALAAALREGGNFSAGAPVTQDAVPPRLDDTQKV